MSEQFNQELSLSGRIPTGHFNAAFDFRKGWQQDAANTKALAFDGVFLTLYSIALEKSQLVLADHVKQAVPSSWDPAALARYWKPDLPSVMYLRSLWNFFFFFASCLSFAFLCSLKIRDISLYLLIFCLTLLNSL